jgi:hypothetical protein
MLSVKTCLHWFVRIAWLVGCSLGLFGYLCSTEQASLVQIACQNLATRKQKMVMFLGGLAHMRYVSACGSWKEWLRRCCSTRARVRLGLHLFRATTLHNIFTATTFFPIHSHPLIRSWLIQSSLLLVPLLAGEEPFLIPTTSSSCCRLWCGINHWPKLVSLFMLILCRFRLSFLLDLGTQNR